MGKSKSLQKKGKGYANTNDIFFYEVSAKNKNEINKLFEDIATKCLEKFREKNKNLSIENITFGKTHGDMFFKNSTFGETHKESYWDIFCYCCSKLAFWRNRNDDTSTLKEKIIIDFDDKNNNTITDYY